MVSCFGAQHILSTKLTIPPSYAQSVISRTTLFAKLDTGVQFPLTLLAAPTGFGKTTLVSSWLASRACNAAWLSLGSQEDALHAFWRYFLAALTPFVPTLEQNMAPYFEQNANSLDNFSVFPVEAMLTALINQLIRQPQDVVLVLDNYQVLTSPAIHHSLAFLLEHMPPTLHLVLCTRAEPPLPLSRLRVRGQVYELHEAALRFTFDEATAFFGQAQGMLLTKQDILILLRKTDGWVAGLQLAALALRDQHGPAAVSACIASFSGAHRSVCQYLTEEVFALLPTPVCDFLLFTSISKHVNPSLCDALCVSPQSSAMLEWLKQENIFIYIMEEETTVWYRYHQLFIDFLQHRLAQRYPEQICELHKRASQWFEEHGYRELAIEHAFEARDFSRAAYLLEIAVPLLSLQEQFSLWYPWIERLQGQISLKPYPHIALLSALLSLYRGNIDAYKCMLVCAEHAWQQQGNLYMLSALCDLRAYASLWCGNVTQALFETQQAVSLLEFHPQHTGVTHVLSGVAQLYAGDVQKATVSLALGLGMRRYKHVLLTPVLSSCYLAELALYHGDLPTAMLHYQTYQQVDNEAFPWLRARALIYMGAIYREWNKPAQAEMCLHQARYLLAPYTSDWLFPEEFILEARLAWQQGKEDLALFLLDKAEWQATRLGELGGHGLMQARIGALRVQYLLAQGYGDAASACFERIYALYATPALEMLPFERIYWECARARLLIAHGHSEEGVALLYDLLHTARSQQCQSSELMVLLLLVQAYLALANTKRLKTYLEQMLSLAQHGTYQRSLLDEGTVLISLLSEVYQRQQKRFSGELQAQTLEYIYVLLLAAGQQLEPGDWNGWHKKVQHVSAPTEQLSEREQEVLHLIAAGHTNQQIAQELVVAESTIKTHLKNIYSKLHVNSRLQALTKAHATGLLQH